MNLAQTYPHGLIRAHVRRHTGVGAALFGVRAACPDGGTAKTKLRYIDNCSSVLFSEMRPECRPDPAVTS